MSDTDILDERYFNYELLEAFGYGASEEWLESIAIKTMVCDADKLVFYGNFEQSDSLGSVFQKSNWALFSGSCNKYAFRANIWIYKQSKPNARVVITS